MDDENTVWQPVEPTTPVQRRPHERTARMPNPYEDAIPIPPPPPPKRRGLLWWVLTITLLIMLIPASAGLVYWAYTYHVDAWVQSLVTGKTVWVSPVPVTPTPTDTPTPTPTDTPTPVPTVYTNYSASDIMADFIQSGRQVTSVSYGETIYNWSGSRIYTSHHATSSVQWVDSTTTD